MSQQKTLNPRILPAWYGQRVVIIASGPSLTQSDVDYVKNKAKIIAVNDNYLIAPWADMLYACDLKWWDWHHSKTRFFNGLKYTQSIEAAEKYNIRYIEGRPGPGLATAGGYIHTNHNSGAQAINMAYLFGASQIILLGFDMKPAATGEQHWFGDHPDKAKPPFSMFIDGMVGIASQGAIEIINCSRQTALQCFPRKDIEAVL